MARKYARDNRGRFASAGATARGGRLKTAGGNKRATQTKAIAGGKPGGTIGKNRAAKPAAASVPASKPATRSRKKPTAAESRAKGLMPISEIRARQAAVGAAADATRTRRVQSNISRNRAQQVIASSGKQRAPYGRYSTIKNPAQEGSFPQMAPGRSGIGMAQAAKGRTAAAKPATKKPAGRVSPEKVSRVTGRVNAVTANASSKTGIKRLNATEVGVRAKAFLTRKAGGMSGMVGKTYAEQQSVVAAGLKKPTRYSTQKPNRNKPRAYNDLGQSNIRRKNQAAANIERNSSATSGRAGNAGGLDAAKNIRANSQRLTNIAVANAPTTKQLKTRDMGPKAPDTARSRNNRLQTANRRVKYFQVETDSKKYKDAVAARAQALAARPAGTGSKVVFRGKNKAASRQNIRANDMTSRVRYDLNNARPGAFKATAGGGRVGIRRSDTGNRQLSLLGGPSKKLYSSKRVAIKRPSGKRRYASR